ncbi:hypothetical protein BVRB_5g106650 [Beta vulgaris subsp. vulgaris]|nr:hypothetical protein BVRB_5g106650 [Beta vulgaris subsp. vulgaris]
MPTSTQSHILHETLTNANANANATDDLRFDFNDAQI